MLPGRLGLRFALEALFLVLLAIGAGLAELRPALIVLVMAVAWVLVALVEFTAERIAASPTSYLLPAPAPRRKASRSRSSGHRPRSGRWWRRPSGRPSPSRRARTGARA